MRFFIEDVDNYETSRHDTLLEAVKTLHAAAKRLNNNATQTPAPAAGDYSPTLSYPILVLPYSVSVVDIYQHHHTHLYQQTCTNKRTNGCFHRRLFGSSSGQWPAGYYHRRHYPTTATTTVS